MVEHELTGLQSDNLLAFLALIGLLRALEEAAVGWCPRVSWRGPRWRPVLHIQDDADEQMIAEAVLRGIGQLGGAYVFDGHKKLDFRPEEFRALATRSLEQPSADGRFSADVIAALASDACLRREKGEPPRVDRTGLCVISGQGHQYFLERLQRYAAVPAPEPSRRKKTRNKSEATARCSPAESIARALFRPWTYSDEADTFRWDPVEDRRYALMASNPSDEGIRTEEGANRLAVFGFPAFVCAPGHRRLLTTAMRRDRGSWEVRWPLWAPPCGLAAVRAILSHPALVAPLPPRDVLAPLGVVEVMNAERAQVERYFSFQRGRPLWGFEVPLAD